MNHEEAVTTSEQVLHTRRATEEACTIAQDILFAAKAMKDINASADFQEIENLCTTLS